MNSPPAIPPNHTANEAVRDGLITARVKMRLSADPLTDACDIRVETFHGSVRLSGFVETTAVRAAALGLAWDVEGVQLVDDLLDTRNPG
jgi:osmotically-inducible protein OsmY